MFFGPHLQNSAWDLLCSLQGCADISNEKNMNFCKVALPFFGPPVGTSEFANPFRTSSSDLRLGSLVLLAMEYTHFECKSIELFKFTTMLRTSGWTSEFANPFRTSSSDLHFGPLVLLAMEYTHMFNEKTFVFVKLHDHSSDLRLGPRNLRIHFGPHLQISVSDFLCSL